MYNNHRCYPPIKLFFVLLIFFSITSHAQLKKSFVSEDIFQTNYFIENKGQFNEYGDDKSTVLYGIENNGEHIYFSQNGLIWHLSKRNKLEHLESENTQLTNMSSMEKPRLFLNSSVRFLSYDLARIANFDINKFIEV